MFIRYPPNEYVDGKNGPGSLHYALYETAFGAVPKTWIVHHINRCKFDNSLANLIAIPSRLSEWLLKDPTFYAVQAGANRLSKALIEYIAVQHFRRNFTFRIKFHGGGRRFLNRPYKRPQKTLDKNRAYLEAERLLALAKD